jgi:hypothetical protein
MLYGLSSPNFLTGQKSVDFAGDVALEASHRLLLGQAFGPSSVDVLGGSWVMDHAGDHYVPQGGVRLTITAAVESVPLVLAAAGIER